MDELPATRFEESNADPFERALDSRVPCEEAALKEDREYDGHHVLKDHDGSAGLLALAEDEDGNEHGDAADPARCVLNEIELVTGIKAVWLFRFDASAKAESK